MDRAPERRTADWVPTRSEEIAARVLLLPRGEERERVEIRGRTYSLNGAETRVLAIVAAFRVLPPDDLASGQDVQHGSRNECRHLAAQGLLSREIITDRHRSQHVVSLTREGKDPLDAHSTTGPDGHRQMYYAGVVTFRYFVHKLPILVTGEPPTPTFVFLVTDVTAQAFEEFLKDHVSLLTRLSRWQVVTVAPRHIPGLPAYVSTFDSSRRPCHGPARSRKRTSSRPTSRPLISWSEMISSTSRARSSIRDLRRRFAAAEYEALFQWWKIEGPVALIDRYSEAFCPPSTSAAASSSRISCRFATTGSAHAPAWADAPPSRENDGGFGG